MNKQQVKPLGITADFGMGGHEEHYVVRCWDGEGFAAKLIDCPYELSQAIEHQLKAYGFWSFCDRGSRIEIHHWNKDHRFVSDHVTLRKVLKDACEEVNKALSMIRDGVVTGNQYADSNVSSYFMRNNLCFPPCSIRVSHCDYRPTWSKDRVEGLDLSSRFLELRKDGLQFIETWPSLLRSLRTEPILFLRIDLSDVNYSFQARFLKGFLEDMNTKPGDGSQKRIAVLVCTEEERIAYRATFDNLIASGVKWQERVQ